MRVFVVSFCAAFLCSCGGNQDSQQKDIGSSKKRDTVRSAPVDTVPISGKEFLDLSDFKSIKAYRLQDTLTIDLTGDGRTDKAYLSGNPRRLNVQDGKSGQTVVVGSHKSFQNIADDLGWVDFWGVTNDKSTYEVVVTDGELTGSRTVTLAYPSLVLRRSEEGGGVVTFRDGQFQWVHQAD